MSAPLSKISHAYPPAPGRLPGFEFRSGKYTARFARNLEELDEVLRLRYEVFNLELNEGLDSSHATGRDADVYDAGCHHLIILDDPAGRVVGTYRMQTSEMAAIHAGFYSADEFDFSALPRAFLDGAVELGRACIAREHRNGRVLFLLWRSLIRYLLANHKRYLCGCASLTSQNPHLGKRVMDYLAAEGYVHECLRVTPRPPFVCCGEGFRADPNVEMKIPKLMNMYLAYDVKVCGPPAMDRLFKTIDFFTVFDAETAGPHVRKMLF